jgi:multiple sugar transport system ATP-binding protein
MATLKLNNLRKEFGNDILAVDDLSFEIEDGEFIVIVGPSGCGKSTTLNCIAGLETPTSGDILLGGESIIEQRPQERDIAMVFQNYALYPHMSVEENIGFGLKMRTDMSAAERAEKVKSVAELLEIQELLEQQPKELSGGQRQRVALGRAIARDPEVFLMDEPLSNLDAKLRTQMRAELQDLQQNLGVTTVYVTHDQTEAMTMSDRIVIINDGKLQQFGTPLECYYQPNNRFVAGFIGSPSMNFLEVTIDGQTITHEAFTYLVSEEVAEELPAGPAVLGVRPEDFQITTENKPSDIDAVANVIEPMGDVTNVHLEIGSETAIGTVSGNFVANSGTEISITFPENRLYLFDDASGEAILTPDIDETEETIIQH